MTRLDMVVEAGIFCWLRLGSGEGLADADSGSPHEELNERLREGEAGTFAPDRYAQSARHLSADCEVVLDVGCRIAGVARR